MIFITIKPVNLISSPKNHGGTPWINPLSPFLANTSVIPGLTIAPRSIPGLTDSGLLTRERPRVAALLNGVRKAGSGERRKCFSEIFQLGPKMLQKTWDKYEGTPYNTQFHGLLSACSFSNLPFCGGIPNFWKARYFCMWETNFLYSRRVSV